MFEVLDRLISGLKKVRDVAQRMHDAELLDAIANLTLDSAQLKSDMAAVREENLKLREEIQELRKAADIRSKIELRNGLYYLPEPVMGYSPGPFCTRCLDADGKLVTLIGPGWQPGVEKGAGVIRAQDGTGWTCPQCIHGRR